MQTQKIWYETAKTRAGNKHSVLCISTSTTTVCYKIRFFFLSQVLDDDHLDLFADVDVLGSQTYQVLWKLKQTDSLEELIQSHNAK